MFNLPLIPADAGIQQERRSHSLLMGAAVEAKALGPGVRRDERG